MTGKVTIGAVAAAALATAVFLVVPTAGGATKARQKPWTCARLHVPVQGNAFMGSPFNRYNLSRAGGGCAWLEWNSDVQSGRGFDMPKLHVTLTPTRDFVFQVPAGSLATNSKGLCLRPEEHSTFLLNWGGRSGRGKVTFASQALTTRSGSSTTDFQCSGWHFWIASITVSASKAQVTWIGDALGAQAVHQQQG